jgi:hypothetical protein
MARKRTTIDPARAREEWLSTLGDLMSDLEEWAGAAKWLVDRQDKEITEPLLGTYSAPVLHFKTPNGILYADPIGRDIIGADGRVDLCAWPSLHRVMLILAEGKWSVLTDSGIDWPQPWGQETFAKLAMSLTKAL